VGTELWGFVTPSTVDLALVRDTTAKMQPYYAVPSQYLAMDQFPITRNGKIDKRSLASLAESGNSDGLRRLSVPNRPLKSNPNIPGTPDSINGQASFKWGETGTVTPSSATSLSRSSTLDLQSVPCPVEQDQMVREKGWKSSYVLDDVRRMVCVGVAILGATIVLSKS
jgi:hypothetical protein